MAKRNYGVGGMVGAVVAATLGAAAGCGDGFASSDDCRTSHTCASAAGEGAVGGASDGTETTAGGAGGSDATSMGGSEATPLGGSSAMAGAPDGLAGAGGADAGCRVAADCSNDNAEDGQEICENRECLAGNPPPTIVSFTPESDAVAVEPDTSVVIEFNEPLDPKTVTSTTIQLLDGKTVIPGELAYADSKVTFTPTAPLTLLAPYTLSVTTDVTDAKGAPLLTELSSTFQVRDGAWKKTIDVVKDVTGMSDVLPMTSTGRTLLAWTGNGLDRCPAAAKWFLRGEPDGMVRTFSSTGVTDCNYPSSGGNAAGVAGVVWTSPTVGHGATVQQHRASDWLASASLLSKNINTELFRLAVAPSGATTLFEYDSTNGSVAWTTDAAGNWPAGSTKLSTHSAQGRTSAVFDSNGKGWAVWRAKDPAGLERILASRLATASGNWATAKDLPGSVTATSTSEAQRGEPVVALDSQGDGLALWVDASSSGKLMASRFAQSTWTAPVSISGALVVDVLGDPPALAFDGEVFVAAWSAQEGSKRYAYTARYDLQTGWDTYRKQQTAPADGTSAAKMPRLVSDGRGNLLLVYAQGAGSSFSLMYQRYANDAWGSINAVPAGTVSSPNFEGGNALPLSMSSNGLAALAWGDYDSSQYIAAIHLASFY